MDETSLAAAPSSSSQAAACAQVAAPDALHLGTVLVTGANGFIGSNLVAELTERDCEVLAAVRPGRRLSAEMATRCHEIHYRELEFDSSDALARGLKGIDTVIHAAGQTAAHDYRGFLATNRTATYRLLQAAARQSIPPRVIMLSSVAAAGPRVCGAPRLCEDFPEPVSQYGRSKLAGERVARRFAADLPITAIRPGIVFGPGDREVLRLIQLIAASHLNFLPGMRQPLFPFIAVQDLIVCIIKSVHAGSVLRPITCDARPVGEALGDGLYYAADPQFCSFRQFGYWISQGLAHRWHKAIPLPLFAVRSAARINALFASRKRPSTFTIDKIREAAVLGWECDVDKTMRELHWAPAASLQQRLRETIAWYRKHGWLK